MRLIDADELKKDLKAYFTEGVLDGVSAKLTFHQILHDIDNAPTVELFCSYLSDREVRQPCVEGPCKHERPTGEWKCFIGSAHYGVDEDNEPIWRIRKIYHCPFCNRRTVIKENYCPNCGARMKGGKNEDQQTT